jgi:hypothetical protein
MNRIASFGAALATTVLSAAAIGGVAMDQGVLAGSGGEPSGVQVLQGSTTAPVVSDGDVAATAPYATGVQPDNPGGAEPPGGGPDSSQSNSSADRVFAAMDAGTVTVRQSGGRLVLIAVDAWQGWTAYVEDRDDDEWRLHWYRTYHPRFRSRPGCAG